MYQTAVKQEGNYSYSVQIIQHCEFISAHFIFYDKNVLHCAPENGKTTFGRRGISLPTQFLNL